MFWTHRRESPPPGRGEARRLGKDAWTEAEVNSKDVQESEAFSKEEEQHIQYRDAGENDTFREPKCLGLSVEGTGRVELRDDQVTCEEFGFNPEGHGEPLEDSEQECGIKSVF